MRVTRDHHVRGSLGERATRVNTSLRSNLLIAERKKGHRSFER